MVLELIANSIDQFLLGHASRLRVQIDEKITVSDDGAGLPFDEPIDGSDVSLAEAYLTSFHNKKTADGHAPHIHMTRHGAGVCVVNALSARFHVRSWRNGCCYEQAYETGLPTGPPLIVNEKNGKGTCISFKPDPNIFEQSRLNLSLIRREIFDSVHLFPGLCATLNGEYFYAPNGLNDLLPIFARNMGFTQIYQEVFSYRGHHNSVQLALAATGFDSVTSGTRFEYLGQEDASNNMWVSWANGVRTEEGGSHVDALHRVFNSAGHRPRFAMIHVVMHDPQFAGPTKSNLYVPGLESHIVAQLTEPFASFLASNSNP